jgi:hypothetical protein
MSERQHVEEARVRGRELAQRLKTDVGFRQQIERDPVTALLEAGLSEDAHVDFMREVGLEAEVAGYMICRCTKSESCDLTCLISNA